MTDHTPTPWFVHETKHPHYLGGEHTERRIFTVAIHPQLKDHAGVVNGSVGIGPVEGGPPAHMVSISAEDAALIVKAVNNHEALVKALQRIAEQQLSEERLVEGGDYEYGYEQIIKIAREALAAVGSAGGARE